MYEVRTHGVHFTVSDRLRRHFDAKLHAATRSAPRLQVVDATVAHMGSQRFAVTLVAHRPNAAQAAVHGSGHSVYAAADDAVRRLRHVLERAHDKRADHHVPAGV